MSKLATLAACATLLAAIITTTIICTRITRNQPGLRVQSAIVVATTGPPKQPAPIASPPTSTYPQIPEDTTPSTTLPATTTSTTPPSTTIAARSTTLPATTRTTVTLTDPDMAIWKHIALCEMPGPGGVPSEPWGAHWTFIGAHFSGALGIYNGTWNAAGGSKYGPTAGHATWQQQIEIARVIRDRWGYTAWGCGK